MRSRFPEFVLVFFFLFALSFPQDSLNIRYVGSWDADDYFISGGIWRFGVYNGYLYIAGGFRDVDESGDTVLYHLIVVDVHNPTDPFVVARYRMRPFYWWEFFEGYIYTRDTTGYLMILDVLDPMDVEFCSELEGFGWSMYSPSVVPFKGEGRIYLVLPGWTDTSEVGYYLWDVTDAYFPELVGEVHEFKHDTEWGEDPDWHAIRYGYTAAVDYPYVYVGELKEGQGSEWDPYD
ncbi:hypothetical protein J7K99_07465, partial [bacterium]|nr:hypothetical protein [bacterium]